MRSEPQSPGPRRWISTLLGAMALATDGCGGADGAGDAAVRAPAAAAVEVRMDFGTSSDFYAAPFPSEHRRRGDGTIDLTGFPNPRRNPLVQSLLAMAARDADGFGTTSAVYFQLTGSIDPRGLPDVHASTRAGSAVFLVGIEPDAPDFGRRYPVAAAFEIDKSPYGATNLLSLLPLQGVPLRAHTRYAAVILRSLLDGRGRPLQPAPVLAALTSGRGASTGLGPSALAQYRAALDALRAQGVSWTSLAGFTVFRTGDPTARMVGALAAAPVPSVDAPVVRDEVFDTYCVFHSTISLPVYQRGTPPYGSAGGDWVVGPAGALQIQRHETSRLTLTVPRAPMPAGGYPLAVLIRTGAGGDRPLVDRGVQAVHDGPPLRPGTGPALHFARAGFAGASADGPHGGLRNLTHGDEQFLMFNVSNPWALRDNVRQSALETALLVRALGGTTLDVRDCPGASDGAGGTVVRFDTSRAAVMGHSMGATIAPLALATEPTYRAAVLSGAGGSWIANVMYKRSPVPVLPLTEILAGFSGSGHHLREHDPVLSLFQWAAEPADPPVYARSIVREPPAGRAARSVLMFQGIVDTYIPPPVANALSLALGLDLGAPARDGVAALSAYAPLESLLDLVGTHVRPLPLAANVAPQGVPAVTAVVVQHPGDGIEDGHEVVFQTEAPKRQYECFLRDLATGSVPRVVAGGASGEGCE